MRNALALLVLVSAAASAHASDRERPQPPVERAEPRPCKCARRPPPATLQLVDKRRDAYHAAVLARMQLYRSSVGMCIARTSGDVTFSLSFERGATRPRVSATGDKHTAACLERLDLNGFTAASRTTIVRVRASIVD